TQEQINPGWLAPTLGNTYSGASPIGLTATLDVAKPGDMIFMCSYGSGAGSDAFVWKVTPRIDQVRDNAVRTKKLLEENLTYVDYGTYAKFRHKIKKNA
ncbi:MAG: hydroxymethylglutaryl-CoA synthase, partial [candidate division Zixibacteria bacterium]|nr:hydroxymethylglutaryl-CoA synthase [candidate division Zixibacteria bacterium]